MNARFPHPRPGRFPRLSPAQRILQDAADRAFWRETIAELARNPAPPRIPSNDTTHPIGLEWGTAREARNVCR